MGLFGPLEVSASALTAERLRLDVIANNLANANTTRTPGGGAYRRQVVLFGAREDAGAGWPIAERPGAGVRVVGIRPDTSPLRRIYNPGHPDADAEGYVQMPNVDPVVEMVDLMAAARAYEANVTVINETKGMAQRALELLRG